MKSIILLAALLPFAAVAADDGVPFYASPKELVGMCPPGGGNPAQQSACQNYVAGVVDAWSLVRVNEPALSPHLGCIARTASPSELRQIVSKYVAENAGRLDKPAVFIVREAIVKAYPCAPDIPQEPALTESDSAKRGRAAK